MTISKIVRAAAAVALLCASAAHGFDYSRYQAADLDEIIEQPRPRTGADLLPQTPLKIIGTLIAYGEPCNTGFLKKAMLMGGITQATIDAVPVTRCIKLRTAKGKEVRLFIQDAVSDFLPKEIPLGSAVTLFVLRVFNDANGPGLLTSEFSADSDGAVQKQLAQKSGQVIGRDPNKQATSSNAAPEQRRGEWKRNGPGFTCIVTYQRNPPPETIDADTLANACLQMGPFGIGNEAKTVAAALGPPHRTLPQPNDATAHLYFLEGAERFPYLIATMHKDRIVALQISGSATSKDYTFNHIKLGDDTTTLVKHFGQANKIRPSGLADTDLWAYAPWPFSFEVKSGRVTSVRIEDPAHYK